MMGDLRDTDAGRSARAMRCMGVARTKTGAAIEPFYGLDAGGSAPRLRVRRVGTSYLATGRFQLI